MIELDDEMKKAIDSGNCEVRFHWYGGMMCTDNDIKMARFKAMEEQHYREEREKNELMLHSLRVQAASLKKMAPFFLFSILFLRLFL